MLYSCTHIAAMGIKGLTFKLHPKQTERYTGLEETSSFGRRRHHIVVNDVIKQVKESVVCYVVPLLLVLRRRHSLTIHQFI